MVISHYHNGDKTIFCDEQFRDALHDGVTSGRFVKVRESYLLTNKQNEAYDPRQHEKWLDYEGFSGKERETEWIVYNHEFGLYNA